MKAFADQVLLIKGQLQFTAADVLELASLSADPLPAKELQVLVTKIPIKTIRHNQVSLDPLEPARAARFHGTRLAIHPDVEPVLKFYYQFQLEENLMRARKEIDSLGRGASRLQNLLNQEKANGNELYCRIKRFNDLSFWAKLKRILKGKGV